MKTALPATPVIAQAHQPATDASKAEATLREQLGRFGATIFAVARHQPAA